jgi:predicted O-methyltransferase YrrM
VAFVVLIMMGHLTPRYLADRALLFAYATSHPRKPWLTSLAISILEAALRGEDRGLEWGSGRSTCWFAERTRSLVSVESSRKWYDRIAATLLRQGLRNVDYRLITSEAGESSNTDSHSAYVDEPVHAVKPGTLDYVLVDGLHRAECALKAVDLIKPGGLLILDNAERYLPYSTRSPERCRGETEASWRLFLERVAAWRLMWTSNGVTDTAIWVKVA